MKLQRLKLKERVRSMACEESLQSKFFLYLTLISLLLPNVLAASTSFPTALSGCPDKCGNINITYPFGTGHGCYREGFEVTCDESTTPPTALLGSEPTRNMELKEINITSGEANISASTVSYLCFNQSNQTYDSWEAYLDLTDLPFLFSETRNKFTVIGCDNLALILATTNVAGCMSYCVNLTSTLGDGSPCDGSGCCQAPIPQAFNSYEVFWGTSDNNTAWQFNPCMYAVLAEEDWYTFQAKDLIGNNFLQRNKKDAPVVLDWAIRDINGTCQNGVENSSNPACLSKNSTCYYTTNGDGYLCKCPNGYWGNPYLRDGCIDIDECTSPDKYLCYGRCENIEGDYKCHCPKGKVGNAKVSYCTTHQNFPLPARIAISIILSAAMLLGLCFLLATHLQHKKHKKEKEEYKRYYNMMDNYLRVFSKKQIEIATNNFDENGVLGTGGHGNVYKGYLEDNKPVAIKRSKEVEEDQRAEFVNEILLLSQINHKNIVRLIGCCMEVKIPMLIYEFISNGTLHDLLHGKGKNLSISLNARLTIALESAEALDYLHSTISRAILHGDVKSANILLEDNFCVKVSDFGASNLVPIDDTQVVKVVQGTRGYLDPEYVATAVLTKKSDVYSFGVVLLELITRKCAIFIDETQERKHLASCFVSNVNKKRYELLDKDIVSTDEEITEVLQEVSELAVWCLCLRGDDRPTMRQVVEKLQSLVKFNSSLQGSRTIHEEADKLLSESSYHVIPDTSVFHSTGYSSVLEIETRAPR